MLYVTLREWFTLLITWLSLSPRLHFLFLNTTRFILKRKFNPITNIIAIDTDIYHIKENVMFCIPTCTFYIEILLWRKNIPEL